jgi:hypothetical protein
MALLFFALPLASNKEQAAPSDSPAYTATGELKMPENYREWVFLTSGVDMSYSNTASPEHSVFDNVFVNPSAYREFQKTGTWPDKTLLILEIRAAEGAASINKRGHTQSEKLNGLEVHVKDAAKGGWTFYGFNNPNTGTPFPRTASCYSCHQQHAIVDTTFVQFYPTLLPLAKEKKTINPDLLNELAPPAAEAAK